MNENTTSGELLAEVCVAAMLRLPEYLRKDVAARLILSTLTISSAIETAKRATTTDLDGRPE